MERTNETSVTEFILSGLIDNPNFNILFFVVFLLMYSVTFFGNTCMILLICCSAALENPMYFFLCHLSLSDLCYSSVITPKILINMLSDRMVISFTGCAAQLFFFALFVGAECFIVTVMAYDRYMAICYPLLYIIIMNKSLRIKLVVSAYGGGLLTSIIHTSCTFRLSFCGSNIVNHFFCDIPPLLKLSCTDTFISELMMFLLSSVLGALSAAIILASYANIISAMLKMHSSEGRKKAFSTCSSHLMVVALFFGTAIFVYARPISSYSIQKDKVISSIYTVVIPMLNPIIYSLRNKQVKVAFTNVINKILM
ncbi:olfactory receptor 1019-like [Spea bombifrons]|uniref:olfactory receptor 1019-like n=1 Tax=Spea bombifrons TaxID=233779 RepID=UPI00234A41AF|nr:olfactory receptor 1019-like [Spea bombifrons]